MKKWFLIGLILLITVPVFAQMDLGEKEIIPIAQPSIDKVRIAHLTLYPLDKMAEIAIAYGYVDENNNFISIKHKIVHINKEDYTNLLNLLSINKTNIPIIINNVMNIKQ